MLSNELILHIMYYILYDICYDTRNDTCYYTCHDTKHFLFFIIIKNISIKKLKKVNW